MIAAVKRPWEGAHDERSGELRESVLALKLAVKQIAEVGTNEQRQVVTALLIDARRRIYELLAKG